MASSWRKRERLIFMKKKMKRMFEALYGRTRSYQNALNAAGTDALEAALARNVFGGRGGAVARLAAYGAERRANSTPWIPGKSSPAGLLFRRLTPSWPTMSEKRGKPAR
jgi:hypothetical protein